MTTPVTLRRTALPSTYTCHEEAQEAQETLLTTFVLLVPLYGREPRLALDVLK